MEPIAEASMVLLLVAVTLLPFVVVIGLLLTAVRSIVQAQAWLHDDVPAVGRDEPVARSGHRHGRSLSDGRRVARDEADDDDGRARRPLPRPTPLPLAA